MITLTMERLDHAVVLKLPTDHEHVMVALWRLGLNRDPHMYTLGELNAVFSYDTPEEHQMVRLIDMNNSLHFALCSLHEISEAAKVFAGLLKEGAEKDDVPVLFTSTTEAEAVKLFAPTYLARRVSFFNELDT